MFSYTLFSHVVSMKIWNAVPKSWWQWHCSGILSRSGVRKSCQISSSRVFWAGLQNEVQQTIYQLDFVTDTVSGSTKKVTLSPFDMCRRSRDISDDKRICCHEYIRIFRVNNASSRVRGERVLRYSVTQRPFALAILPPRPTPSPPRLFTLFAMAESKSLPPPPRCCRRCLCCLRHVNEWQTVRHFHHAASAHPRD